MDKVLRAEIVATVKQAMTTYNEKWVTDEVLCEHIGTLTPRFLKDHGKMFNRTRVEWTDENGVKHCQGWIYPLYEIKEMILNGKIKELKEPHNHIS